MRDQQPRDPSSASTDQVPSGGSPGKRPRTAGLPSAPPGSGAQGWAAMLGALGVSPAPAVASALAGADDPYGLHLPRGGKAAPPIQRQVDPGSGGVGTSACLDPEAVLADLLRIEGEAAVVRAAVDPGGTAGAGLTAEVSAGHTEHLRALTHQAEVLRPHVVGCGVPTYRGRLASAFAAAQDTLVGAYQMLAVYHADQTLQAWSNATADDKEAQRDRYHKESGGAGEDDDWCGMFVDAQYRAAGMSGALNMVFNSTVRAIDFFTYGGQFSSTPMTIVPHGQGQPVAVRAYHEERGALRSWLERGAVGDDLRPGDVVILEWLVANDKNDSLDGLANRTDHVAIVRSYTPGSGARPGLLVTIDGNAYGTRKPGPATPAFDGKDMGALGEATDSDVTTNAYQAGAGEGRDTRAPQNEGRAFNRDAAVPDRNAVASGMTIFGRGRPSAIDFETDHVYSGYTAASIPAADEPPPLQSPIQRSEAGAVAAADPHQAFDVAAGGGAAELPYRAELEARLGADFGGVEVFTGRDLAPLGAHAATRGEQVVFAAATPDRETVAHELTHVLQHRRGHQASAPVSDPGDASEREARAVAASLAGGAAVDVEAAPSAAIHRQEGPTRPPAVQPPPTGNHPSGGLDYAAYNYIDMAALPSGSNPNSIREIFHYYLLHHLRTELPELVAAFGPLPADADRAEGHVARRARAVADVGAFIVRYQQDLMRTQGYAAAEAVRVRLFTANQHAVVDTLRVETSLRYRKDGDTTFCNVYAYDVVTALGGYLPRVWWTPRGLEALAAGARLVPRAEYDARLADANPDNDAVVHNDSPFTAQVSANGLDTWMTTWGEAYGWRRLPTALAAQTTANHGRIVIILASTGDDAQPGHVSVVLSETAQRQRPAEAATGGDYVPLQSQAGAENYDSNAAGAEVGSTGRRAWWADGKYVSAGFWAFLGEPQAGRAIARPERLGTTLPEAPSGVPR